MKKVLAAVMLTLGLSSALPAAAAVIDFSQFAAGTTFDGPLSVGEATFISSSGSLLITNFGAGNAICAAFGSSCAGTLSLSFSSGVSGFETSFSGDDVAGSTLSYQGQTPTLAFTGRLPSDGDAATATPIRLPFSNLSFISFTSDDPDGVALGNVSFTSSAAVPEPTTWAMMIVGMGVVGTALRRRRSAVMRPQAI